MDNQEVTNNVDITWLIYQSAVGWIPIIMDLITFHGFIIGIGSNQQYGLCKQLRRDKWTGWEFNVNSPMKRGPLPCPCGGCESLINMGLKWIWNWLVVWNMLYFPIYWEFHNPNWRTHMFQTGWNHQAGKLSSYLWVVEWGEALNQLTSGNTGHLWDSGFAWTYRD